MEEEWTWRRWLAFSALPYSTKQALVEETVTDILAGHRGQLACVPSSLVFKRLHIPAHAVSGKVLAGLMPETVRVNGTVWLLKRVEKKSKKNVYVYVRLKPGEDKVQPTPTRLAPG